MYYLDSMKGCSNQKKTGKNPDRAILIRKKIYLEGISTVKGGSLLGKERVEGECVQAERIPSEKERGVLKGP